MKKIELGMVIAILGLLVAIIGLFFNGLYTQQVKDYFEKWFNSSSIPTTSPSISPPIQVSPTPTQDLPTVILPPSSPSPIPSQELPNNDSTPAVEASNCNSPNIGVLKSACSFNNRVSYSNQEQSYFFNLDKPSDISIYLDNVTSSVGMRLYVDTNGNGVIDSGESLDSATAYSSAVGVIKRTLGIDKYIVVVKFNNGNSDYNLQFVNNTHEAKNVGSLKGTQSFIGSINRNSREKYYKFSLSNTSDFKLFLDEVTNNLSMRLYVDKNGNGIIDSGESLDSATAYSSNAGVIKQRLGADNYFVVITETGKNTYYKLTMFAP